MCQGNIIRNAFRIYAKAGAFLGIMFGFSLSFVLGVVETFRDTLIFCLYHIVLFVVPMTLAGVFVHLFFRFVTRRGLPPGTEHGLTFHRCTASGASAGLLTTLLIVEIYRPYLLTLGSSLLLLLIFVSVFFLTAAAILFLHEKGTLGRRGKVFSMKGAAVKIGVLVFLLSILTLTSNWIVRPPPVPSTIPVKAEESYRLLVVGLDGASWGVIDRMVTEGRLPNLERLISTGARAELLSEVSVLNPFANTSSSGMRSSSAWTSIATGKTSTKHGIHDFMVSEVFGMSRKVPARIPTWSLVRKYLAPLGIRPVSRSLITPASRKAVTLWEILSRSGYTVGVLGWWLLDAGLPVNGYKVENAFVPGEGTFYPDSLVLPQPDPSPDINRFTTFEYDPDFKEHYRRSEKNYSLQNSMHTLVSDFKRDSFTFAAARTLGDQWPVDLHAVYFLGPDNVQHLYWKYMEPDFFPDVTEEDRQRFGRVIENYYEYLDGVVGTLEAQRRDSTVIVICSDHGMGPWVGNRGRMYRAVMGKTHIRNSGNHRREGILIMQGGPVRRGASLENMRIHDIAPTVLHLLGLPIALDMDGRVITQAFGEAFLRRRPVRAVPGYQNLKGMAQEGREEKSENPGLRERLKALGYIE